MNFYQELKSRLISDIVRKIEKIENGNGTITDAKKIELMLFDLKTMPRDNDYDKWFSFYLQILNLEIRYGSARALLSL